jgi:hypothetical protein
VHGESVASDASFWGAIGVPNDMIAGISKSASDYDVWQCNLEAFNLFQFLGTQWRVGYGGREGIIYAEAYCRMTELGITRKKRRLEIIEDIQVMESEALHLFAEARKK